MVGQVHFGSGGAKGNELFRRSLFAVAAVAAGEKFTAGNVRSIRPGHGLPPCDRNLILGRRARQEIAAGTPLSWNLIE
jgi:sialic acid synthase SpsE